MAMALTTNGGWYGRRSSFVFPEEMMMRERELMEWRSWAQRSNRMWPHMSDGFWVYIFKVKRCDQSEQHDWTECPFAHRHERARRRDPRRYSYLAVSCPDFRAPRGRHVVAPPECPRGRSCHYAHGVFELWLHPHRFRTRMCDAGIYCPRRICFFAHFPGQRRREDDVVPFDALEELPRAPRPCRPPPRLRRRARVVEAGPATFLPRPGMVMQTRAGDMIPLMNGGDEQGASSSSSSSSGAAAAATPLIGDFNHSTGSSAAVAQPLVSNFSYHGSSSSAVARPAMDEFSYRGSTSAAAAGTSSSNVWASISDELMESVVQMLDSLMME